MIINANTTIAAVLKQHPEALEAIIRIHPRYSKLRNPLLRRLMAGRTTLAMAAKIGSCTVDDFFNKLSELGFQADKAVVALTDKKEIPAFMHALKQEDLSVLDVRPVMASGEDPLNIIMKQIKTIQPGQTLKIINSFEPVPLVLLLEKRGFSSYTVTINNQLVETYFHKNNGAIAPVSIPVAATGGWDELLLKYQDQLQTLDVRSLEMPGPMLAIMDALETLPAGNALFVYHKRIPVFLLPELAEKNFDYRIKEIRDGEVQLLIFKQ